MEPGAPGYGQPPHPAEEPTWASRALNLGNRPATVPGWEHPGEPTWAGAAPPAAPYEPAPHQPPYGTASHPVAPPPAGVTRGYPTGGYPAPAPTTFAEPERPRRPRGTSYGAEPRAGYGMEPGAGYGAEPTTGGARTAVAERPPGAEEESWRDRAAKATTPFKRRKGGAGKRTGRTSVAMLLLVSLTLLAGGGFWYWSSQGARSVSGEPYFDTLSVSALIDRVSEDGFECIPGRSIAQCEKKIPGADLSVTLHFDGETEVTRIEASGGTEAYSEEAAAADQMAEFFGMAAELPVPNDPGAAEEAKAWVAQNVGKSGAEAFGGIQYESSGDQQLLTMRPVE